MSKNVPIRPGVPAGARPVRTQPGSPSPFIAEQMAKKKVVEDQARTTAVQEQEPEPDVVRASRDETPSRSIEEKAAELAPRGVEETAPAGEAANNSQFMRIDIPSGCPFYDWHEISQRRLDVFDQAKVAVAVKYRNWTALIDAVQATCNRDTRELAVSDFYSLLVWHKHHSYVQGRSRISYVSIYGNRVVGATPISIKIVDKKLNKTRAEYLEAKKQGFAIATVRDLETVQSNEISEETLYLFEKAQYIDPEPLAARIAELRAAGDRCASITARIEQLARMQSELGLSEVFDRIEKFEESFAAFSIEEVAVVRDSSFDPKKGLAFIEEAIANAEPDAPRLQEFIEERDRLKSALQSNQPVEAKLEEVPLAFDPWTMFLYT